MMSTRLHTEAGAVLGLEMPPNPKTPKKSSKLRRSFNKKMELEFLMSQNPKTIGKSSSHNQKHMVVLPQDVPKFDIVVSEVMDLWCLGEGIIPTMRHAHKKLLAPTGVMLPGKLRVYVQPLELSLWKEVGEILDINKTSIGHIKTRHNK